MNNKRQSPKNKPVKTPKHFRGICLDAEILGVTRQHLWMVLTGQRVSRRLLHRYHDLKRHI